MLFKATTKRTLTKGQVMVLTVLALGGTVLGATTIAGLLTLYELRQTSDLANSAKAIFAADAGIEQSFYNLFCAADTNKQPCPAPVPGPFVNGAKVTATCYDASNNPLEDCTVDGVRRIRSLGESGNASRAFQATF